MMQQNIFLCFFFSALTGFLTICARAVVLRQVQREKKGLSSTRREKHLSSVMFFLLEGTCQVSLFFAPWFGPVSLVLPTKVAAKLLFNVIIIGGILQHEKFDKKAHVGTAMVAIAVIYLPITGPKSQDNQDLMENIIENPLALIWLGTVTLVYVVAVTIMVFFDMKKFQPRSAEGILLLVGVFSNLGNTVSKAASLVGEYGAIYSGLLLGFGGLITVLWIVETMKEPLYVRSFATYVPTDTLLSLLFNLATGLIVWGDGATVTSWPGYIIAYILMALGVYLISDIDFLLEQGKDLQNYQERVLADLYHPRTIFEEAVEEQLTRARYEKTMSKHQLIIMDHSRHLGLKRGNSDPEIHSLGSSIHGLEGCDRKSRHGMTESTARDQLAKEMNMSSHSETKSTIGTRFDRLSISSHGREMNTSNHSQGSNAKSGDDRLSRSCHNPGTTLASTRAILTDDINQEEGDVSWKNNVISLKKQNQISVEDRRIQYQNARQRLNSHSSHSIDESFYEDNSVSSGDSFGGDDDDSFGGDEDWDCEAAQGNIIVDMGGNTSLPGSLGEDNDWDGEAGEVEEVIYEA